jgi:hypothetical protein
MEKKNVSTFPDALAQEYKAFCKGHTAYIYGKANRDRFVKRLDDAKHNYHRRDVEQPYQTPYYEFTLKG